MKLEFVCVGVQKAGTTSLHDMLNMHSQIGLPRVKEARFVEIDEFFALGKQWFFNTYFDQKLLSKRCTGYINPNIQLSLVNLDRLKETFGSDLRVILMLRNPIDRAYSHYWMSRLRGIEKEEFLSAVVQEEDRLRSSASHPGYVTKKAGQYELDHFGYVSRSIYSPLIQKIVDVFGRERLKVVFLEDLVNSPEREVKGLLKFLNCNSLEKVNYAVHSNRASGPRWAWLNAVLYDKKRIVRLSNYLPRPFVLIVSRALRRFNTRTGQRPKPLSKSERKFLYDVYFKADIANCERILNRELGQFKK